MATRHGCRMNLCGVALLTLPVALGTKQGTISGMATISHRLEKVFAEEKKRLQGGGAPHRSQIPLSCEPEVKKFCPKGLLDGWNCMDTNRNHLAESCYVELVQQIPHECHNDMTSLCIAHKDHELTCLADKVERLQGRCQQLVHIAALGHIIHTSDKEAARKVAHEAFLNREQIAAKVNRDKEQEAQTLNALKKLVDHKVEQVQHETGYKWSSSMYVGDASKKAAETPERTAETGQTAQMLSNAWLYACMSLILVMLFNFLRGSKGRMLTDLPSCPEKHGLMKDAPKSFDTFQRA
eukprot:gb/GFBE01052889.1/.p1 GENE.gb/GFBE01052889.1/~~gb/GFBE01052889.1/.p1  ORF type:complete len:295 (+),score=70.37 gb/GFBE01052889.1/:1-885(+)